MRREAWLIGLVASAVLCLVVAPFVGTKFTTLGAALHPGSSDVEASIFWTLRVPRVLTAFLAGAALAVSGMVFQAMFRNPLATESTLGVASGASFGAALQIRLGLTFTVLGISGSAVFAFLGAALSMVLVFGLTGRRNRFSPSTMLLSGVAISFFFSSLILMVQSTSDFHNSYKLLRWLMGSLSTVGFGSVVNLLPFTLIGTLFTAAFTKELNLLSTGDDIAASRGVSVRRTRWALFLTTSLSVGGVVSVCGPIGFVGMIAPHVARLIVGNNHRYLLPATLLLGGAFLTLCDTAARTVTSPGEMPVGAVTALLGGPFFLWLLIGEKE